MEAHEMTERKACRLLGLAQSTKRYPRQGGKNDALRKRLRELAEKRPRVRLSAAAGVAGTGRLDREPQARAPALPRRKAGAAKTAPEALGANGPSSQFRAGTSQ